MIIAFRTGATAPAPFWPRPGVSGAILDQIRDSSGGFSVYMPLYLPEMTEDESESIRTLKVRARYFADGPFFLGLIRFGSGPLVFELEYTPDVYPAEQQEARRFAWEQGRIVHMLAIDSATGVLRVNRMMTMPNHFRRALLASFDSARSYGYDQWIDRLRLRSVLDLWEFGLDGGRFGEGFD